MKDKNTNSSPTNGNGSIAGKKRTSTEAALNPPASTSSIQNSQTNMNIPQTSAQLINSSGVMTSAVNPSFSSPTTTTNSIPNLLYYQRFANGTATPLTPYTPTTPVSSVASNDLSSDVMSLLANSTSNSKDIGDALQNLLRMDGRFNGLLSSQNGLAQQYSFSQQLLDAVTNGTTSSTSTGNNPY